MLLTVMITATVLTHSAPSKVLIPPFAYGKVQYTNDYFVLKAAGTPWLLSDPSNYRRRLTSMWEEPAPLGGQPAAAKRMPVAYIY